MSFLSRIFRKPAGPADPESWQVGDWAECVHMGRWYAYPQGTVSDGPRHGRIGRVTAITIVSAEGIPGGKVLALAFAGWPGQYFVASAFRKVNPRADEAVAAEAEFTELVRRKPAPAMPREIIRELQ